MSHSHHAHHHHAEPGRESANIILAFVLNTLFAVIELIGGYLTGSIAITSDALHDFGDTEAVHGALGRGTAQYGLPLLMPASGPVELLQDHHGSRVIT